jgi:hypothetical protein
VIPALGRLRQKYLEFKASLGCIARSCFKKNICLLKLTNFLGGRDWCLNSGLHSSKEGVILLEAYLQFICPVWFLKVGSHELFAWLDSNYEPLDLCHPSS